MHLLQRRAFHKSKEEEEDKSPKFIYFAGSFWLREGAVERREEEKDIREREKEKERKKEKRRKKNERGRKKIKFSNPPTKDFH